MIVEIPVWLWKSRSGYGNPGLVMGLVMEIPVWLWVWLWKSRFGYGNPGLVMEIPVWLWVWLWKSRFGYGSGYGNAILVMDPDYQNKMF